jgi:AraC-like DNA-binding protein
MTRNLKQTTTHAGIAMTMARTLQSYGVDVGSLFESVGLSSEVLPGADQRIESVRLQQLWRAAEEITGDSAFGIRFAENMHPGALQGLGFSWVASNTLYEAFIRLVRYYRVIATAGEIVLEDEPTTETVTLIYETPGEVGDAATVSLDAALAVFVQLCRFTKDPSFGPTNVSLRRAPPADQEPFDQFFRCPVIYSSDRDALVFDRLTLDESLPMGNPELARANDQVIVEYLKRHDRSDISNQVRACIIECLPSGSPSQATVAESLHMSVRSLQRKLGEQEQTFSGLLESIRRELAEQYLTGPRHTIAEVAYLLGYSEPGNFTRSFKRWSGKTPQQFQTDG